MERNKKDHSESGIIEEVNFLRGFGILAVIAIHTTGYFTEIDDYGSLVLVNLWTDIFSQFAVPLFICISGFVLAGKYRLKFSLKLFYLKRIRSIIPQYLIFSFLYTLFNNWDVMRLSSPSANLTLLGKNIWHADASYHFWFFALIIAFYLCYPLIIKFYDFAKNIIWEEMVLTIFLIIQLLWMVGVHTVPNMKVNFIAYLFYFGLGIYACDHFASLKINFKRLTPVLLTLSAALTVGASFFIIIGLTTGYRYSAIPEYYFIGADLIYPVLRVVTFLLLLNLAVALVRKRGVHIKMLYRLGEYSFGIYLIHIFFNQTAIKILNNDNIGYNNWLFYPIVFTVTVVVSYLAVRLLSYIPYSYFLIGHGSRRK